MGIGLILVYYSISFMIILSCNCNFCLFENIEFSQYLSSLCFGWITDGLSFYITKLFKDFYSFSLLCFTLLYFCKDRVSFMNFVFWLLKLISNVVYRLIFSIEWGYGSKDLLWIFLILIDGMLAIEFWLDAVVEFETLYTSFGGS